MIQLLNFLFFAAELRSSRIGFIFICFFRFLQLNYEAALRDCAELRRWQREMDLTTPEIISYLIIYDEDMDRARTALAEDTRWHR